MMYANQLSFCSFFEVIQPFLGKLVIVEVESYTVIGKLVHYGLNGKRNHKPHKPNILILKNGETLILIRGSWTAIKLLEPNKQ